MRTRSSILVLGRLLSRTQEIAPSQRTVNTGLDHYVDTHETHQTMPLFPASEIVANAAAQIGEIALDQLKVTDDVNLAMERLLSLKNVRVGDVAATTAKLRQMVAGGTRKLLVISDFDYTLSRFNNEAGERLSTTHGVFDDNAARIDPELGKKFVALRDKYYPIEFHPTMTVAEKIPHMEAWWGTSHGYIVSSGFTKPMIEDFVRQSRVVLRDGADDLIRDLEARGVPLVIFSAGIGNIIEIFLRQKLGKVPANTHFISNMILFDENDKAKAFSEPLIHTFCKNSSVITKEATFFHEICGRTNVILLGDSMGDIHMDVGVEKDGPTLRIGFFNGDVNDEALLSHYIEAYDILLIHDSTTRIPQSILDLVTAKRH